MTLKTTRKPIKQIHRPRTLHEDVQAAVRAYILDNDLRPGDPLPSESQMSEQLGVSRNVLRESLRALESLGIVEIRRGSGYYVREFTFDPLVSSLNYGLIFGMRELSEILDVRRALEDSFIEAAIAQMDAAQIAELERILEHMRAAAYRGEAFAEHDRAFHRVLFEKLGNSVLLKMIDMFWLTFHEASARFELTDQDPVWTYQLHVPIVDAIKRGQAAEARQHLADHHSGLTERMKRAMEKSGHNRDEP
jgi:DNA-binding FadR family transcriptional regulator